MQHSGGFFREALTYIDQQGELALCTELEQPVGDEHADDEAAVDDAVCDDLDMPLDSNRNVDHG